MKKKMKKSAPKMIQKKIIEMYFMAKETTDVKKLSEKIKCIDADKIELWLQLDLMEIVLENDSLIFQNAADVFEDPLDLEFLKTESVQTVYQISFDEKDTAFAITVLADLLTDTDWLICSDSDDFTPIYNVKSINELENIL